jgi:hypothetical protein
MSDDLAQYRINSEWRHHVLLYMGQILDNRGRMKKKPLTVLEYCGGDQEYASAMDQWIEFMEDEERYSFYVHFALAAIADAKRSMDLLRERIDSDPVLRMPLLRDAVTCYSRPFKASRGRLGKTYRLASEIGEPSPRHVHRKILADRDSLYAHCDLSAKEPRVSVLGIGLKGAGAYWQDYERILPDIQNVFDNAEVLIRKYIAEQGMEDRRRFFARYENPVAVSARTPERLNQLHGSKSNKRLHQTGDPLG